MHTTSTKREFDNLRKTATMIYIKDKYFGIKPFRLLMDEMKQGLVITAFLLRKRYEGQIPW